MNFRTSLRALVFFGSCIAAGPGCSAPAGDDGLASEAVAVDEGDAWGMELTAVAAASPLGGLEEAAAPAEEGDLASLLGGASSLDVSELDPGAESQALSDNASLSSCTPALIGTQVEPWQDIGCGGRQDTTCCWGFSCTTYYNACYLERFQRRYRSVYRSWDCSTTYGSWSYEYKLESRPVCH